jgi:hypothetical protein
LRANGSVVLLPMAGEERIHGWGHSKTPPPRCRKRKPRHLSPNRGLPPGRAQAHPRQLSHFPKPSCARIQLNPTQSNLIQPHAVPRPARIPHPLNSQLSTATPSQ